ncbi:MAG: ribosomal L7Ae/L30e/S12e/Gadd45 family protein [Eubacteriales bacterium]
MPKTSDISNIVVGTKQTLKLLHEDALSEVMLAQDADSFVTKEIEELAISKEVSITYVESMKKLGKQCNISVGAAAAGIVKTV